MFYKFSGYSRDRKYMGASYSPWERPFSCLWSGDYPSKRRDSFGGTKITRIKQCPIPPEVDAWLAGYKKGGKGALPISTKGGNMKSRAATNILKGGIV